MSNEKERDIEEVRNRYNYGIDLLKIMAMMFIVMHHILGHGGVLNGNLMSVSYNFLWSLEAILVCSVDCFAMVSGFVGYKQNKKVKYSRYFELWFQVTFYSVGITVIMLFLSNEVGIFDLAKSFLPVTFNQYWYFSAYTGVFLMMPFLNFIVDKMEADNLRKAILVCILAFSFYASVGSRWSDPFKLNNGYSIVWLSFMYLLGAILKKYKFHEKYSTKKTVTFLLVCFGIKILWIYGIGKWIGHGFSGVSYSYLAPTTVGISIGLIMIFSKIRAGEYLKKIVTSLGPTTFGVYLLHEQIFFSKNFITDKFVFVTQYNLGVIILVLVGSMIVIFLSGSLIDRIRAYVFRVVKVRKICQKIEEIFDKIFVKLQML